MSGRVAVVTASFPSRKSRETAKGLCDAINPNNIFYADIKAVDESITGDEHWALEGAICEWLRDEQ